MTTHSATPQRPDPTGFALFEPIELGRITLPNRIVMAPMTRSRAGAGDAPGSINAAYYAQRASAGLIVTEGAQISPQGKGYPFTPGIYSDAQIAGWKQVTDAVHREGGRIFVQLAHVGRVSEMGTLASSLAHELNQPLTAVATYCESARDLLENDPDAETLTMVREALDEAAEQAVRAGQIVRRLRDFMSNGEMERRVESLQRLMNEANALALVGSREHGIDVQLSLDPRADLVFVDRIQVQQVLVNLIRNAIDAMMDSRVRSLAIRTSREADDLVRVTIEDTGSGINEAVAPQLFQPFVTSKQNGMGIGLSICRTIVEAHGGRIWFEQGSNGGTAFHFTLPSGDTKA